MKRIIKYIPEWIRIYKKEFSRIRKIHKGSHWMNIIWKTRIIFSSKKNKRNEDYNRQMKIVVSKLDINFNSYYIYPYDSWVVREIPKGIKTILSITVDFGVVLESDLNQIKCFLKNNVKDCSFAAVQLGIIEVIENLKDRILKKLSCRNDERSIILHSFFEKMLYRKPLSMDEAIQKILFYDALFWQANHWHIGLGRLDVILEDYYRKDVAANRLDKKKAKELLTYMIFILGKDFRAKSRTLVGDTGQYILLGGINNNGITIGNDLTKLFLEIFEEYNAPDPKLILRVNKQTKDDIWAMAVNCISQGHGSPLIMNEGPIMKNMKAFGYHECDLYQLGTSACWEPLIIGKSFDQNNTLPSIISIVPLNDLILDGKEYDSFEELFAAYKNRLTIYINSLITDLEYDCSPLFSLFFSNCLKKEKDFSDGGSKYSYHGIQVVSFPNTINALLNLKRLVYKHHLISLQQCKQMMEKDFIGMEDMKELLCSGDEKFGKPIDEVISITNELMSFIGDVVSQHKMNGFPLKVGFSSPNYITSCKGVGASLDGRKADMPFAVHLSPISSNVDISEIMEFATHLNYSKNRINGNVVDFIVPNAYLKNREKFLGILKNACSCGLFELQLNVLSYQELKDAKAHPEKYPNLIVRVWGFSAYFNDLPEAYKDNLIERAKLYESA